MLTNIYNIAYAPSTKQAYFHFWGCNFECRACLAKKTIYDFMLPENVTLHLEEPKGIAKPPDRFLDFEEVMKILDEWEIKWTLLVGQEAALDPQYPQITKALHERCGSYNVLLTNAYEMPPIQDTDQVVVSLKALNDSIHRAYTGKSNKRCLQNFVKLYESGANLTAETLLIPEYIDIDEVERIARFVASVDKDIPLFVIAYFKAGNNPWRRPTPEEVEEAVKRARKYLNTVRFCKGDEKTEYEVTSIFPKIIKQEWTEFISEAPLRETRVPIH